ncbi:MAG: CoA transferase [Thermoflexaceae bacterium]|nr:CoA transferase [Thermoflexaceae bacterium]
MSLSLLEIAMPGALDGIRVIDFGQYIAGPHTAMLLADQGRRSSASTLRAGHAGIHPRTRPGTGTSRASFST